VSAHQRLRLTTTTVALAALIAVAGATGKAGNAPVLTLAYSATNTLELTPPGGSPVGAGAPTPLVPPGAYQVVIIDSAADGTDPVHMFQLSGPGVNLLTDLQGGDDKSEIYAETLASNSTYTFQDDDEPSLAAIVFQTSSTPAPAAASQTTTSGGSTTAKTTANGSQSSNSSIVGSKAVTETFRGNLAAGVSANGKLSLTREGKRVTTLKAGRYDVTVLDRSGRAGFVIQELRGSPRTLARAPFTGTRKTTIVLSAGQWFFYSTILAAKSYFSVVA
jgi:hypothetical protein